MAQAPPSVCPEQGRREYESVSPMVPETRQPHSRVSVTNSPLRDITATAEKVVSRNYLVNPRTKTVERIAVRRWGWLCCDQTSCASSTIASYLNRWGAFVCSNPRIQCVQGASVRTYDSRRDIKYLPGLSVSTLTTAGEGRCLAGPHKPSMVGSTPASATSTPAVAQSGSAVDQSHSIRSTGPGSSPGRGGVISSGQDLSDRC